MLGRLRSFDQRPDLKGTETTVRRVAPELEVGFDQRPDLKGTETMVRAPAMIESPGFDQRPDLKGTETTWARTGRACRRCASINDPI